MTGVPYRAIPGPSVMPEAVLRAMQRAAPDIYAADLEALAVSLAERLRRVARSSGEVAIWIGNGHAAWEAALANLVEPGERVLAAVTGHFGRGWAATARARGAEVDILDHGLDRAIDPDRVEDALRRDRDRRIRAVLAVQTDTASTVLSDLRAVRAAMDAAGHPALLVADCVASLGCDRFEMDGWGVDVALSASQKGLMTPPGLAFVWFNARADTARDRLGAVSPWWDWRPRARPEAFWQRWGGTAPTHHLWALDAALDLIEAEGIERVWARHERLARAVWAAGEAWGESLRPCLGDRAIRSHAVTAFAMPPGQADALRAWCEREAGLTLGIGLGREPASAHLRLAHMGHVNAHMTMGALGCMEAGLRALGLDAGEGALSAAAAALSG